MLGTGLSPAPASVAVSCDEDIQVELFASRIAIILAKKNSTHEIDALIERVGKLLDNARAGLRPTIGAKK